MNRITHAMELDSAICRVEYEQIEKRESINKEIHDLGEHLKPINLLKEMFNNMQPENGLKTTVTIGAMGLASGFTSRIISFAKNILNRLAKHDSRKN